MTIRASAGAREVTAVYSKDESTLELIIRLPPAYPLQAAEAQCTRRMGVGEKRLNKWLLSVSAFLRNTNGVVAEALHLWREVCAPVLSAHSRVGVACFRVTVFAPPGS